jgi:hypothetical protein
MSTSKSSRRAPRLRLRAICLAVTVLVLAAGPRGAFAVPILPGQTVATTGTTPIARPEFAGDVLEDVQRHFHAPDGHGGMVRGYLEDCVYRSQETGSLVFSQRIVIDTRSSNVVSPQKWTVWGMTPVSVDADYLTDEGGSLGASSVQRGNSGDSVRFQLPRPLGPGESSYFHEMLTNALSYDDGGRTVITGPDLPPITLHTFRPVGDTQPWYTVTKVADYDYAAFYVNDFGQLSMTAGNPTAGYKALLWQPAVSNGTEGVAYPIPQLAGFPYNVAGRINNRGQVAGTDYLRADLTGDGASRAFLWTPTTTRGTSGSALDLGVLPGGTYSLAASVNDRGEVAGTGDYPGAGTGVDGLPEATSLLWADDSVVEVSFREYGHSQDINASGQIAGDGPFTAGTYQGFLWTPTSPGGTEGNTVSVNSVGGSDYQGPGSATALNDRGTAVGTAQFDYPAEHGLVHGYVWSSAGGGLADLGYLEMPRGINNADLAVGTMDYRIGRLYRDGRHATLNWWASPNQQWSLRDAFDVNDLGQITSLGSSATLGSANVLLTPVHVGRASPRPCGSTPPFVVTMTGTGFLPDAKVLFDGAPMAVTRIDADHLQFTVPEGFAGHTCGSAMLVVNPDGTVSNPVTF